MHLRDNVFTLSPRTPPRAPNLAPFLKDMHGKSFNAPELIKEDLLCFYKFSRKGVKFVGDLEEHPASFLDLQEALAKLGDEEEEEEGEQEEGEVGDDAEDNPPPS
ncbi:hypothetical protein F511_37540 [Dorcoceras hygrometricum]|uniref:Uncharacterized protein n=1 Tax=Dorcoceras hygrometricum TaxID=472368 RepID=A0A2Z7CQD5_9LAMI|nr:hypothetical protein F511_37540 [Dorcoceras hygrometricum]